MGLVGGTVAVEMAGTLNLQCRQRVVDVALEADLAVVYLQLCV